MKQQLTIFDVINNSIFDEIKNKLSNYGIDDYYIKNFKGKNELLMTIAAELSRLDNYDEYINLLFKELKKYIPVINEFDDNFWNVGMYMQENSIRICEPKAWYPIFCLEMLNKDFLEGNYETNNN